MMSLIRLTRRAEIVSADVTVYLGQSFTAPTTVS